MKFSNKLMGVGFLTAFTASLCCITPILALIAGSGGLASNFNWLEPARPFLIGLTVLSIGFSWYHKLKLKKEVYCNCGEEKSKFTDSKLFLGIVTITVLAMLAFPYYSDHFYAKNQKQIVVLNKLNITKAELTIDGMTCKSCEKHIDHEVNKLSGIINSDVTYENGTALITFDGSKTSILQIEKAINATGYTVTNKKLK